MNIQKFEYELKIAKVQNEPGATPILEKITGQFKDYESRINQLEQHLVAERQRYSIDLREAKREFAMQM